MTMITSFCLLHIDDDFRDNELRLRVLLLNLAFIDSSIAMSSLQIFISSKRFKDATSITILICKTHHYRYSTYYSMGTNFETKPNLCILTMKLSPSPWGPASSRKSKPWKSIGVSCLFLSKLEVDESENLLEKLFQFGRPDWSSQKVDPGPALCANQNINYLICGTE